MRKIFLLIILLTSRLIIAQSVSNSLVAYYPFNGNANDATANGLNATFINATLTKDRNGEENSAYYFDGYTSYISIPSDPKLSPSAMTNVAWVKFEKGIFNFVYPVLGKGAIKDTLGVQYYLAFFANEDFEVDTVAYDVKTADCDKYYTDDELNNTDGYVSLEYDTWYHVASSYSNGVGKVYINGELVVQANGVNQKPAVSCTSPFVIGAVVTLEYLIVNGEKESPEIQTVYFQGSIDEVQLYNRALTDEEVKLLYESTTGITKDNYLSLNEMVYPNPSTDGRFYLSKNIGSVQKVTVTDAQGIVINANLQDDYIDLSSNPSGIYMVKVITNNKVFVGKIKK